MTEAPHDNDVELTRRQSEVLAFVAMGFTALEIGDKLSISPRTARAHVDALKRKLGASRSRELPLAYRRRTGRDPVALLAKGAL